MASSFSRMKDDLEENVQDQIAGLSKEIASLKRSLSRRGSSVYGDTRDSVHDLYEDVWNRVSDAVPEIRRGARRGARAVNDTARDNPVATVVAVGVVGLLATLLLRRGD